jgi:hypothetical protein
MSVLGRIRAWRARRKHIEHEAVERPPREDTESDRAEADRPHAATEGPPRRRFAAGDGAGAVAAERDVRAAQHEEYGGLHWGAAFFGWLVAVGVGAILTALLAAAGTALALSDEARAETLGVGGAIGLIVIALIAYFAGGYVAGRMSRFDGARQGLAVWVWFLIAVAVLAVVGAIAGEEYNVFGGLDLPRIPIDEGDLTAGGIITLIVIALGTLLAAMAGGKLGESYHRRVDRVGFERAAAPARGGRFAERDRPVTGREPDTAGR